jgi:RNase P protein component
LRELFRQHQDAVPAGCDLLLIARAAAAQWPMAELEQKLIDRTIPPPRTTGGCSVASRRVPGVLP